jgi:predicted  nucleic acid-binding Zn-ribbon protein
MTEQTRSALRELQALDLEIANTRDKAKAYEPRILEVEEPANEMEKLVERTRGRIKEMRVDERRLELSTTEKRTREEKLKDRLNQVRNVREEAAVNAELEMVQRALEAEETEALGLLEQIRRMELDLEEQVGVLEQATEEVGPRREALVKERDALLAKVEEMQSTRESLAEDVDAEELRVYDAIRGDRGRAALAALTEDGACGNCFSMIPLQLQQEIIRGESLFRCEGCGVILSAPIPEEEKPEADAPEEAEGPEAAAAEDASGGEDTDASSAEDADGSQSEPAPAPEPVAVADAAPEPARMPGHDEDAEEKPEA